MPVGTDPSAGGLTQCEAASHQQFVQQRRVCEIGWGDGEVGVSGIGGCGIEQLGLTGVEIDRLGADEHD